MAFNPISLTPMSADTLAATANFLSGAASAIINSGNTFLEALAEEKQADFFNIGDLPAFDSVALLVGVTDLTVRPTRPDLSLADISHKIDQLAAVAVPVSPALATPSVAVPDLTATAPTVTLPSQPVNNLPPAPTDAPSITDPVLPDAPTIVLPAVPTFEELQLPVAPSFTIPTLSATAPQNLLTPPTNTFGYVDPGYTSTLRDPLIAKLLNDLVNGGYGIDPTDEVSLWNRARDRETQASLSSLEEVKRQAGATSFPMPQGAYYKALDKAREELQAKASSLSREIALKRSELYVENRKFTMTEVRAVEQQGIELYNAIQERALNFAKASVELGIAIYDAQVKDFQTKLDAYRTEVQTFGELIRAELTKAELFKAQIEAERLRADFNTAKIQLYTAQLSGINTTVQVYRSRLEAVNVLAQIQQQKLEAFKTRVEAYAQTVQAKEAEYGMYRAAITGELAKVDIYKSQIEAYNATLSGVDTKARITLQSNQALIQQYDAAIKQYEASLESFVKQISAKLDTVKANATVYGSDVDAYRAYVQAVDVGLRTQVENVRTINERDKLRYTAQTDQVKFRLEEMRLTVENAKDINKWGAEFFRTALGAALNGINGLAVQTKAA